MTDPIPAATADGETETGRSFRRRWRSLPRSTRSTIEWILVVVGALLVALVARTYLVQTFYIPSASMTPTLAVGDRILVNKLDDSPGRGDIVVFARPGGPGPDGIADLVKRVIALPGEDIEARNGRVFLNGSLLEEPYLPAGTTTTSFDTVAIPADHIWVMGDNRSGSQDSRVFGAVPIDDVVGRAFVIIWPLSEIGTI